MRGTKFLKSMLLEKITAKKIAFIFVFTFLALIAQRINFANIVGDGGQYFTLFNFFAPVAGFFLGPVFGVTAVLLAEIANYLLQGTQWTVLNMLRLIPMLVATYYFGTRNEKRLGIIIPALAILAFILHPVGRTVWFYTLFWIIPMLPSIFPTLKKWLYVRSLAATFQQHAIGGAVWIWTVPMAAEQWVGLMPVVPYERAMFAAGIALSYIAFNFLLARLDHKWTSGSVTLDSKYSFAKA